MCGIAGFAGHSKNQQDKGLLLKNMLGSLRHRGPDDEGLYIGEMAVFGIRRLSIIDLATGHQPIHNEDSSIWIVCNGEIYNFLELKDNLEKRGHTFYTKTDTEVIIHLYEEYGIDCVKKLNGMFAFAVWDGNNKSLFLVRDRFGIKPLYYMQLNDQLVFASEPKSILKFPGVSKEIDLFSLDGYLALEYVPSPYSIFKGIKKLPAAHLLVYKDNAISIQEYWDIVFKEGDSNFKKSQTQIEDELLFLLKKSIKRHLISDVPLGVFLSGGIDSSAIVALLSDVSPGKLKTFSIGFNDSSFDESEYSKRIADLYQTEHHAVNFAAKDILALFPDITNYLDEPIADASFFPTYFLSRFARSKITVALSGDGADEVFAGYPTYQAHKLARYYSHIPNSLRKRIIEKAIFKMPVSMNNFSLDFKMKKFISGQDMPFYMRHFIWMGSFSPEDRERLYTHETKQALTGNNIFTHLKHYFEKCKIRDTLNLAQYADIKTYLQDDLLVKIDRASMANSLEVRVPYLDHELVEFMFKLPPKFRLNNFKTKYIFKKSVKGILPVKIINRQKKGFGVPVGFWIKNELRNFFYDTLGKTAIKRQGLFNYQYVEKLLDSHIRNKQDNHKKLWTLLMFQLWQKNYA